MGSKLVYKGCGFESQSKQSFFSDEITMKVHLHDHYVMDFILNKG